MESVLLSHEICRREIGVEKRTSSSRNACPFPADIIVTDHVSCKRTCSESRIDYTARSVQMPTISPKILDFQNEFTVSTLGSDFNRCSRGRLTAFPEIFHVRFYLNYMYN